MPSIVKKLDSEDYQAYSYVYYEYVKLYMRQFSSAEEVNSALDSVGFDYGSEIGEEYLRKYKGGFAWIDFKDSGDHIVKALRDYLDIMAEVQVQRKKPDEYSIVFKKTTFTECLEFPQPAHFHNISHLKMLSGMMRGALRKACLQCTVTSVREILLGDEENEIQVKFVKRLSESDEILPAEEVGLNTKLSIFRSVTGE